MASQDKLVTDRARIDQIIRQSQICHLACSQEGSPYVVPISFGYDGQAVYLHTAKRGRKIAILEKNPQVCLAFVARAELVTDPERACQWSFDYASVVAEGIIREVIDPAEKAAALNQIMAHYSGRQWDIPDKSLAGTRIWKVVLETPTAKISPVKE